MARNRGISSFWTSALSGPLAMFGMDTRAITRGMSFMNRPDAGTMLGFMGEDTDEQVEAFAAMLRNSSDAEIAAMVSVFQQAMVKAETGAGGPSGMADEDGESPSRRRRPTAADRRADRRRERRSRD